MSDDEFCKILDSLSEIRYAAAFVLMNQLDDRAFCSAIRKETEAGIEHSVELRRFVAKLRHEQEIGIFTITAGYLAQQLDRLADDIWQTQGDERER